VRSARQAADARLPHHARVAVSHDRGRARGGRIGDRITSYFGEFGEFEGSISDTRRGRILLELEMTPEKREWMADKLTWLENKQKDPSVQDGRHDARFIPQTSHTT